jgi:hypothetical protein
MKKMEREKLQHLNLHGLVIALHVFDVGRRKTNATRKNPSHVVRKLRWSVFHATPHDNLGRLRQGLSVQLPSQRLSFHERRLRPRSNQEPQLSTTELEPNLQPQLQTKPVPNFRSPATTLPVTKVPTLKIRNFDLARTDHSQKLLEAMTPLIPITTFLAVISCTIQHETDDLGYKMYKILFGLYQEVSFLEFGQ